MGFLPLDLHSNRLPPAPLNHYSRQRKLGMGTLESTLRLFKAVPVTSGHSLLRNVDPLETYRKTLSKGFVLDSSILASYSDLDVIIKTVDAECGLDPNRLNRAFHKSFDKVRAAPMEQLFLEQVAHYLTTYGAEVVGLFDADRVFIPVERLDVPAIDIEVFDFVIIRGMTFAEMKEALLELLHTGAALSAQTVKDCLAVASTVNLSVEDIEQVRNREVKIGLYELYGKVPVDPVEFLRYVVYKTTGSTLLIKSPAAIDALKQGAIEHNLVPLFNLYGEIDRLGEIFLRFKPLFLALRADKTLRPTINRIRRSAERNHKPMPENYLNSVTAAIKHSPITELTHLGGKHPAFTSVTTRSGFDLDRLTAELDNPNVSIFRKIRLANALSVRADRTLDSIMYKVRNGKSFATEFKPLSDAAVSTAARSYSVVIQSIVDSLTPSLRGKRVYIPRGVIYGLPATEKQFSGNLPAGTSVRVPNGEALVAGIYWEDQGNHRIDLDLSISDLSGKIGWDGSYRDDNGYVMFSGDNTSAPNGASEVFWFDPAASGSWMMDVNYFNYNQDAPVPFKIVVGTADASSIKSNFVIDPNRLLASASTVIDTRQMNLGIVVADPSEGHRFFVSSSQGGGGISARHLAHDECARKFMMASMRNAPTLNEILANAGAVLVDDPLKADEGFNLSPAAVDKTTFLSLLS